MIGDDIINNTLEVNYNIFDSIRHIDKNGYEYWYVREIMIVLEYSK